MLIKTKQKDAIFPMPVLLIATFNDDNTVNVMNAAWGMMVHSDTIALNLDFDRKTLANIKNKGAFTVSLATSSYVKEADYFGIVSGNKVNNKLAKTCLTFTKSELVNAPVINELPVCMQCEYLEFQDGDNGCGVIGKVIETLVDDKYIKNGKIDVSDMHVLAFDPLGLKYYEIGKNVGKAFSCGLEIKNMK